MNARRSDKEAVALFTMQDTDMDWHQPDMRSAGEQRADIARYIGQMVTELAQMAANSHLDTVNYLLTMAQMEAEVESRRAANADTTS